MGSRIRLARARDGTSLRQSAMLYLFIILNALAIGSVIYHRKTIRRNPSILWGLGAMDAWICFMVSSRSDPYTRDEWMALWGFLTAINAYACGRIVGGRYPAKPNGEIDWDKASNPGERW
jgi:hypothetical protein